MAKKRYTSLFVKPLATAGRPQAMPKAEFEQLLADMRLAYESNSQLFLMFGVGYADGTSSAAKTYAHAATPQTVVNALHQLPPKVLRTAALSHPEQE